jgi:hypothetical protein
MHIQTPAPAHTSRTNSHFLMPPHTLLTYKSTYTHEYYPLPAITPPFFFFSHTHPPRYASSSHPHAACSIDALSYLAWNRAPVKYRHATPDVRNFHAQNLLDVPVLGPCIYKHAPFPGEFSEPRQETVFP